MDRHIEAVMQKLRPRDLRHSLHYTLGTGDEKTVRTRNVCEMLWHLIEEELEHRGELNPAMAGRHRGSNYKLVYMERKS